MPDTFVNTPDSFVGPPRRSFAIAPGADETLPTITRAIYVGTGGTLVARLVGDSVDQTYRNVASGSEVIGCFSHVRATSTTDHMLGRY